jgi:hypothetical protein
MYALSHVISKLHVMRGENEIRLKCDELANKICEIGKEDRRVVFSNYVIWGYAGYAVGKP